MKYQPFLKLFWPIVFFVLIPLYIYSFFQFLQSNENEKVIKSIYGRQLETLLFSVNQHCWDRFQSWVFELSNVAQGWPDTRHELESMLRDNSVIGAVYFQINPSRDFFISRNGHSTDLGSTQVELPPENLMRAIRQSRTELNKLANRAILGYLQPLSLEWDQSDDVRMTCLIFPIDVISEEQYSIASMLLDDLEFIREIIIRKLEAMNEGDLLFGIVDKNSRKALYLSDEMADDMFEKSVDLWILPNLELQMRLKGTTLDEIAHRRTQRNLIFLVAVNITLLAGALFIVRGIVSEMELARIKTAFVANVSHELRTPLSLIRMYAETLELNRVVSETKKHHYYKTIVSESVRLTQLINNILDFSHIESKRKQFHLHPASLSQIVQNVLDTYQFRLQQNGFTVALEIAENLPEIFIDQEAVIQAVVNLIDNAMKFSIDKKWLKIGLYQSDRNVIISVQDRGIGIPKNEQDRIFQKFYRIEQSNIRNNRGSGLGLTIVKYIMDIHGGKVSVESQPNIGSTFRLIFPSHCRKEN